MMESKDQGSRWMKVDILRKQTIASYLTEQRQNLSENLSLPSFVFLLCGRKDLTLWLVFFFLNNSFISFLSYLAANSFLEE